MHSDQKGYNETVVRVEKYLESNKHGLPPDSYNLYMKLVKRLKRINLESVSEMDWKISFEATKLFQPTEIRGEVTKIFKYVTNIYNDG